MKKIFILAAALSISALSTAQKIQNGDQLTISRPVNHDLYLAGGTVIVNAPVHGDLFIGAGTVVLNDTVSGDITAAGGKITINGFVAGDIRGLGGEVHLNGIVGEDVVLSAGNMTTGSASMINGDMYLGVGTAVISGTVQGDLTCRGGDVQLLGTVAKNVDCRSGSILVKGTILGKSTLAAETVIIDDKAVFYQDVNYWQKGKAPDFKNSIRQGKAVYDSSLAVSNGRWQYIGFASVLFMIWYLGAVFVFIFLVQYFFGKVMKRAAGEALGNTVGSVGRGLLFFLAVPAAALVLMLTVVGLPLGILVILAYALLLAMAGIISSVLVANWIGNTSKQEWGTGLLSLVALIVFIVLKLITLIPFIGWLIMFVICCLAFGSLVTDFYNRRKKRAAPVM